MINWLIQSFADLPDAAGSAEYGRYLNDEELAHLQTLKSDKRRNDWLLGRWTAKRLLQKLLWEQTGTALPLDVIAITNNADGVPDYHLPNGEHPFSISISHGHERAFVAAIAQPRACVGADCILCNGVSNQLAMRNLLITAVWSAKDAALKALHLGLSVDTHAAHCLFDPLEQIPVRWLPFAIRCENGRLPQPAPHLTGWWRMENDFVLTIVAGNIQ